MLKATKALFDDFNTDKNLHLLRTAGAGHAKRMGELSSKAVSCPHQQLFIVPSRMHCSTSLSDSVRCLAGVDAEEMKIQALWKVAEPLFSAYLNRHLPVDLAAKMAGCSGTSSYFVLRAMLKVPQELMDLGPIRKSNSCLEQVSSNAMMYVTLCLMMSDQHWYARTESVRVALRASVMSRWSASRFEKLLPH